MGYIMKMRENGILMIAYENTEGAEEEERKEKAEDGWLH